MGTWGTGIFDNDDASDLREEFRDLIAAGRSAEEATAELVESHGAGDGDLEVHDFWLALAATQHALGHVGAGVIERALAGAHRLPGRADPHQRREDERLEITLIGEPDDPPSLRILENVSDEDTPTSRSTIHDTRPPANWVSGWVLRWSQVEGFLHDRGL